MKKVFAILAVVAFTVAALPGVSFALPKAANTAAGDHLPEKAIEMAHEESDRDVPSVDIPAGPLS